MKAYVLHGLDDLRLESVPDPVPAEDEVLVRVRAAGICGSDIPRIYTAGTYSYPLIPGHEFSGVVEDIGKKVNSKWLQKRVGVFPLIPCMSCSSCQKGRYELCRNYDYLGSRRNGGFAEYVTVPEKNLIELPKAVSFEGGAILEPMAVAVHAIRQVRPEVEETVAVYGMGTIGIFVTAFLKEMAIKKILVIGNKPIQCHVSCVMGIPLEHYCDSKVQDVGEWLSNHTGGIGVDVAFECVGTNETVGWTIQNMAAGGRIQLVGNPVSDMSLKKDIYWKLLRNQLTIKGGWNSTFLGQNEDDWHYVLQRLESKKVTAQWCITQKLCFSELEKGLHIMRDKRQEYIKVMIHM